MSLLVDDGLVITPAAPPPPLAAADTPAPAEPTLAEPKILNVFPFKQGRGRLWCWAACATMILHFLDKQAIKQECDLVNENRQRKGSSFADCCNHRDESPCSTTTCASVVDVNTVLDTNGIKFNPDLEASAHRTVENLRTELVVKGQPVQIGFEWAGSRPGKLQAHVIVVRGYGVNERNEPFFFVNDPFEEYDPPDAGPTFRTKVSFDSLRRAYGMGRWRWTWTDLHI
jgi:hypothetical protein